jgi:hypothetical protein
MARKEYFKCFYNKKNVIRAARYDGKNAVDIVEFLNRFGFSVSPETLKNDLDSEMVEFYIIVDIANHLWDVCPPEVFHEEYAEIKHGYNL